MIKLVKVAVCGPDAIELRFNDGSHGIWSAADILARDTVLTRPLAQADYFARAFIEAGALAWPNGLEFSAGSLRAELERSDALQTAYAA